MARDLNNIFIKKWFTFRQTYKLLTTASFADIQHGVNDFAGKNKLGIEFEHIKIILGQP